MSRRSDILDEMGLTPRWRLRDAFSVAAPAPGRHPAAVDPAPAAAAVVDPAEPSMPIAAADPDPVVAAERSVAGAAAAGPVVRAPSTEPAPPVPPRIHAPVADPQARVDAILRMDWAQLEAEVSGCTACPLAATRKCTVFGIGDRRAAWLFVGEGPGAEEDERGEPFVGQAGRLLDNMLAALGMQRGDDVYVANIVKCRPPGNRVPAAAEVAACEPYLHRQIALLQPKVIVALGKTAAVTLLGKEQSIASMRGRIFRYRDTPLMVTYHPAYLLRTQPDKIKAWEDLCFIREKVAAWRDAGEDASADASSLPMPMPAP